MDVLILTSSKLMNAPSVAKTCGVRYWDGSRNCSDEFLSLRQSRRVVVGKHHFWSSIFELMREYIELEARRYLGTCFARCTSVYL
jgi:hypothetical protein